MHHVQREHWIEREREKGACRKACILACRLYSLLAGPDYDSYFLWLLGFFKHSLGAYSSHRLPEQSPKQYWPKWAASFVVLAPGIPVPEASSGDTSLTWQGHKFQASYSHCPSTNTQIGFQTAMWCSMVALNHLGLLQLKIIKIKQN